MRRCRFPVASCAKRTLSRVIFPHVRPARSEPLASGVASGVSSEAAITSFQAGLDVIGTCCSRTSPNRTHRCLLDPEGGHGGTQNLKVRCLLYRNRYLQLNAYFAAFCPKQAWRAFAPPNSMFTVVPSLTHYFAFCNERAKSCPICWKKKRVSKSVA